MRDDRRPRRERKVKTRHWSDKAGRRNGAGMKAEHLAGAPSSGAARRKRQPNPQGGSLPKIRRDVRPGFICHDIQVQQHQHNQSSNFLLKGADPMQPATVKAELPPREPSAFTRRIGSTTYTVGVHFSKTSKDTIDDKIVRLIRREAEEKAVGV